MKHLLVPCRLKVAGKHAQSKVHQIALSLRADHAEPASLRCPGCKLSWPIGSFTDWKTASCSNCYSSAVWIKTVRLQFINWGENNGGKAEMLSRYEKALARLRQ